MSKELYDLLVRVVKACTGLDSAGAEYSLSLQGVNRPAVVEVVEDKTPVIPQS